jgi:hypothetical protein
MPHIEIRKPIRPRLDPDVSKPTFEREVPLCATFPEEGTVQLKYNTEYNDYTGLFSFTIYINQWFLESKYFIGLLLYAELVHTLPYFENVGIILYTDQRSYPELYTYFGNYKKIIFAIPNWPTFNLESGVEPTVLRCMRYQALEIFPTQWICIRDADTLFVDKIEDIVQLYENGFEGTTESGTIIKDCLKFLTDRIGEWEQTFISKWIEESKKSLCIGVDFQYMKIWHRNSIVYWPVIQKNNAASFPRKRKYNETTGKSLDFIPPLGILAGFTNFLNDRPNDIWLRCFDYITARYSLLTIDHEKHISNNDYATGRSYEKIGKDERMLLYGVLPRYLDKIYFFTVLTKGGIEFYPRVVSSPTLLIFNTDDGKVTIKSADLHPEYINNIFNDTNMFTKKDIEEKGPENLSKLILQYLDEAKLNDKAEFSLQGLYHRIFANFIKKYEEWYSSYIKMKNDEFSGIITQLKSQDPPLTNSDFNSPPRRISASRIIGGRKRKTKRKTYKKRRNNRSKRIHKFRT